jgi:uncharacterized protein (DUF1015 family)
MYLDNCWYKLTAKPGTFDEDDAVDSLDVSILQNNLLTPILEIEDPRTDQRIEFVGGIRGLEELEKRVKAGMKVAFSLYPTSIEEKEDNLHLSILYRIGIKSIPLTVKIYFISNAHS